jgi:hypothetical protein
MALNNFIDRIRTSYKDFWTQIKSARVKGEHELRKRFMEKVIENGLGYPKECIHTEKDRTDIWLIDNPLPSDKKSETMVPTVAIEIKDFDKVDDRHLIMHKNQALSYAIPSATEYAGLTNFRRFYIWRIDDKSEEICDRALFQAPVDSIYRGGLDKKSHNSTTSPTKTRTTETHSQPITIQNPYSRGRNPYISETRF